ncbi:MAG TPA: VWA domain-containing protein, partial [Candidatus Acidoferrum sp.]|nr:VWA domain-containing protein [Candidatus Acidoferrum sp.]
AESQPKPTIPQLPASLMTSTNALKEEGDEEVRIEFQELGNTVRLLGRKPGERVLLLASPGFILPEPMRYLLFLLVDQASRSDVIINTLDARGLYTPDLLGDISQPSSDPPQTVGQAAGARLEAQFEQQFLLMDFAYDTGGRFFHNSNDLEGGLKQLGNAPEVSYVLGFSPQNLKLDGHFHTIKVTVTGKPKYAIQARRGYFAPKKADDPREAAKQEIQEAVLPQNEIFELPMSLQTQYFKTEDAGTKLSVVSHLDVRNMKFRKSEGRNFDDVTVATVVFDDNGKFVMGSEKFVKMRLLDASLERMGHTGFVVKSTFDLKAGKYLVRQVVQDSEGAQMAARSAIVVIPD